MSWEKKIYCPDHSSLGIALRHLRVSITDHNSLLETNSWGKAAGWRRLDCFTFEIRVPGCLVSIFSHSGMLTALSGLQEPCPCHPLTPMSPQHPAIGKLWDLDGFWGLSLLSPAPGNLFKPEELKGLPLSPAVMGWRNDHRDTRLFLGSTDPHILLECLHSLVT